MVRQTEIVLQLQRTTGGRATYRYSSGKSGIIFQRQRQYLGSLCQGTWLPFPCSLTAELQRPAQEGHTR